MRLLGLVPLALVAGGCWTPGPGQLDPTRYPWDQPRRSGTYCIVSLETGASTGITVGGGAATHMSCAPFRSNPAPSGPIKAKGLVPPL